MRVIAGFIGTACLLSACGSSPPAPSQTVASQAPSASPVPSPSPVLVSLDRLPGLLAAAPPGFTNLPDFSKRVSLQAFLSGGTAPSDAGVGLIEIYEREDLSPDGHLIAIAWLGEFDGYAGASTVSTARHEFESSLPGYQYFPVTVPHGAIGGSWANASGGRIACIDLVWRNFYSGDCAFDSAGEPSKPQMSTMATDQAANLAGLAP